MISVALGSGDVLRSFFETSRPARESKRDCFPRKDFSKNGGGVVEWGIYKGFLEELPAPWLGPLNMVVLHNCDGLEFYPGTGVMIMKEVERLSSPWEPSQMRCKDGRGGWMRGGNRGGCELRDEACQVKMMLRCKERLEKMFSRVLKMLVVKMRWDISRRDQDKWKAVNKLL